MPTMIGRTLGHYRIEEPLGKGGMGEVFRAVDDRLQRSVALKLLAPEMTADPERRGRFLQEARAACAVTHPAIAQVFDVGESDGAFYIAMELVEGRTVRELIERRELDVAGAVEIAVQVANGLAKAHDAGIVHRDVKSDNVMVTPDGHAKILDFGLAKLHAAEDLADADERSAMATVAATQVGMVLGTIGYMSPEQARARPVDHRSDLFSLGVVLYEMVAGERPFRGANAIDTLHAIAYEETRPITTIRAHLPPSLQRVVGRCLRKRAEDRYGDARELSRDLQEVQREIESGISSSVPLTRRLVDEWHALRERGARDWAVPVTIAVAGLAAVSFLIASDRVPWGLLVVLAMVGAIVWRRFRNRNRRLLRRFVSRVRKMPEVRAVVCQGTRVTVVVDRALAKTYVRVQALIDKVNDRLFWGEPFAVTVRDDLDEDDVRGLLRGGGVFHVREDDAGER
jgi:serine/threonine protein kinase